MANRSYSTFKQPPASADAGVSPSSTLPPPIALHPHARVSWSSRLLLSWVTPLMAVGNDKQLAVDDIWDLEHDLQTAHVSFQFARDYAQTRSILSAFFKWFGWRFALAGIVLLFSMLCNLFGPLVLNHVLSSLTSSHEFNAADVTAWILALFVTTVLQAFASNYGLFDMEVMNLQFTAGLKSMMYQKSLRLSPKARKETSTGAISNMYLTDCFYVNMAGYYTHQMWLLPLQIVLAGVMLFHVLGVACFAGLTVVALMLLGNSFFTKQAHGLHASYMQLNDARMKRVTAVFKAISVVKLNAWEDKMVERVEKARAAEVASSTSGSTSSRGDCQSSSASQCSVHVGLLKRELTSAIVFTSLALFQLIQTPLRAIAQVINFLVGATVATKRIGDFFNLEEIDPDSVLTGHHPSASLMTASAATSTSKFTGKDAVIVSIQNAPFS